MINCCDLITWRVRERCITWQNIVTEHYRVPVWHGWNVLVLLIKHSLNTKYRKRFILSLVFRMHSVKYKELSFFISFSGLHPLPPVDLGLKANWSQCCPIWEWSRLLRSLICLVWWALAEVIQPLNLSAYLSNSWANTHSPSALGLIFKHLEKTGPSVYASIFPHICT